MARASMLECYGIEGMDPKVVAMVVARAKERWRKLRQRRQGVVALEDLIQSGFVGALKAEAKKKLKSDRTHNAAYVRAYVDSEILSAAMSACPLSGWQIEHGMYRGVHDRLSLRCNAITMQMVDHGDDGEPVWSPEIEAAMSKLTRTQRKYVESRFIDGLTFHQMSETYDRCAPGICQITQAAIKNLKKILNAPHPDDFVKSS